MAPEDSDGPIGVDDLDSAILFSSAPSNIVRAMNLSRVAMLMWVLVLSTACGDDEAPVATCTGTGCECTENTCECVGGSGCTASCGAQACDFTCESGSKCNADGTGAVTLACNDSSECKGNGGDASVIICDGASKCELKAGAGSAATCQNSATCKFNLGPSSAADCRDTSSCNIKCEEDCRVSCAATSSCDLTCGPTDKAGEACPDGRLVCGEC